MTGEYLHFKDNALFLLVVLAISATLITYVNFTNLFSESLEFSSFPHEQKINNGLDYTYYLPPTLSLRPFTYNKTESPGSFWMMKPPGEYRRMTCPRLYDRHVFEREEVYAQCASHFYRSGSPLHPIFRDPFPLCGRYMLSFLTGERDVFLFRLRLPPPSEQDVLNVTAGQWSDIIELEQCGLCLYPEQEIDCIEDIDFVARLVNENRVVNAEVVRPINASEHNKTGGVVARKVRFLVPDPGEYTLEVKLAHLNSFGKDDSISSTLGTVSGWGRNNGHLTYTYNSVCDVQRHVYGSPLRVRVLPAKDSATESIPPLCNITTNYNTSEGGQWVRFIDGTASDSPVGVPHPLAAHCSNSDRYCSGNTSLLNDLRCLNRNLVWVPSTCRLRLTALATQKSPLMCRRLAPFSRGPTVILFVGGSSVEEHYKNCRKVVGNGEHSNMICIFKELKFSANNCSFVNMEDAFKDIFDTAGSSVSVLVTNLGMEGPLESCNSTRWKGHLHTFAQRWRTRRVTVLRGPYTRMPPFGGKPTVDGPGETGWQQYMWDQNERSSAMEKIALSERPFPFLEWALWLSPTTVHHTLTERTQKRSVEWDHIAYEELEKLGFTRLDMATPTRSRQEGSWDGTSYMALFAYEPFSLLYPRKYLEEDGGGVAYMLFVILLNVVCFS